MSEKEAEAYALRHHFNCTGRRTLDTPKEAEDITDVKVHYQNGWSAGRKSLMQQFELALEDFHHAPIFLKILKKLAEE